MKLCWCILAGTEACKNCNNVDIAEINSTRLPLEFTEMNDKELKIRENFLKKFKEGDFDD